MSASPKQLAAAATAAPVLATKPIGGVLVAPGARNLLRANIPVAPARPPNNASEALGSSDLAPIVAPMVRVLPYENMLPMTGGVIPVSNVEYFFRRAWFYGIATFAKTGIPGANNGNLNLGNSEARLPWVVQPYAGYFGIMLDAPIGHVYDLNKIFVTGALGDALFFSIE